MAEIKFSKRHEIKEDRFLETVFHLRKKAEEHKKVLGYILLGVLVVAVSIVLLTFKSAKTNEEAAAIYGKASMYLQSANYTEGLTELKKIADQYSGSSSAAKAVFLTGSVNYDLGNYKDALEAFKKYVDKYSGSEFLDAAVYKGLGASYMQLLDYTSAVTAFKKAVSSYPKDFQIPEIRYKLALCYIELKEVDKAKAELAGLVKDSPKSQFARQADLLLVSL
ncbi:MAG: tetratricopeptide repeat protein [Fibrobacteres bacterium]|nr:tetratricopeptide repeat protein [Fibrobacterota bacterium]